MVVAYATGSGRVRAFDVDTGAFLWVTSVGDSSVAGVRYGPGGGVFVWQQNAGPLWQLDPESGAVVGVVVSPEQVGVMQGRGFFFLEDGDVLVAGGTTDRVARFDGATGEYEGEFVAPGAIDRPYDIARGPSGSLYITAFDADSIVEVDGATGDVLGEFVPSGTGGLDAPYGITFGPDGNLYTTARDEGVVYRFDGTTGAALGRFNSVPVPPARGLAFGPDGHLYVCSWVSGGGVFEFGPGGSLIGVVGAFPGAMFVGFRGCEPCPPDLAPPIGVLDFTDVVFFLGAFTASLPEADFVEPFGQWDFSDVVAFLSAFASGCP